jgi:hypothetical protein
VSPVKYEQGFYILEDDILHSLRRENFRSGKSCGGRLQVCRPKLQEHLQQEIFLNGKYRIIYGIICNYYINCNTSKQRCPTRPWKRTEC